MLLFESASGSILRSIEFDWHKDIRNESGQHEKTWVRQKCKSNRWKQRNRRINHRHFDFAGIQGEKEKCSKKKQRMTKLKRSDDFELIEVEVADATQLFSHVSGEIGLDVIPPLGL